MRLTQKPGSVSSLPTNSNAALSFSATHFAALSTLPQRLSSFSGSFDASALTFAWPWEILAPVSPGIFWVPPCTFVAWASISLLVEDIPDWNLDLTLPVAVLTLPE